MADPKKRQELIKEWLEKKHVEYMGKEGAYISQSEMAELLGIDRAVFNRYYNGFRLPTGDNVDKIARLFGPEVYDLLGLARPDPDVQKIVSKWHYLPPWLQKRILRDIERAEKGELPNDEATAQSLP